MRTSRWRQAVQHRIQVLAQQIIGRGLVRGGDFFILDEITEDRIFFIVGRSLQRKRPPGDLYHVLYFLWRDIQRGGELFHRGVSSEPLRQLVLDAQQLVDLVAHMDRHTNGAPLIGDCTGHRLPDPPGCIRAEFMAAPVIELLRGSDQADIPFLDQVQKWNASAHIFLRNRDHQA